jgi:hypothetical protein
LSYRSAAFIAWWAGTRVRVGNFRQKTDWTKQFVCSGGISAVPNHFAREKTQILYRGTKIEANSRNFVPNHSAEEKTTQNSFPWNKNSSQRRNFVLKHFAEENMLSILFIGTRNFRFESLSQKFILAVS